MINKQFLSLLLSIIFIALFAQITIPVSISESNIPISGQTFAVLLVAYILHQKHGTIAVGSYVLLGLLGLPIFADGKAGWNVLMGGSGGFLIGFIVAAYVVGLLGKKGWGINFPKSIIAMTIGTAIILFFGVGRLSQLYGWEKGVAYGFYPFWQGAIIKIILGAAILPLFSYLKRNKRS